MKLDLTLLLWLFGACLVGYLSRRAWRHLSKALDDVFQLPIHNPYNPDDDPNADYYGDIPNPVDRRHD